MKQETRSKLKCSQVVFQYSMHVFQSQIKLKDRLKG